MTTIRSPQLYRKSELEGYTEGATGPSVHQCRRPDIQSATISGGRVILACYSCNVFWFTGSLESDYLGEANYFVVADMLYSLVPANRKHLLLRLNEPNVRLMYKAYKSGLSLAEVGNLYGMHGSAVRQKFAAAGLKPRHAGHPLQRPFQTWRGETYTLSSKGYYRKTTGDRTMLHVDVWERHRGPVPEGHEIVRRDHNIHNNRIGNLMCLPKAEASAYWHRALRKPLPLKPCLACGEIIPPHRPDGERGKRENYAAYMKRKTCNPQCSAALKKGKARGWKFGEPIPNPYPEKYCGNCGELMQPKVQVGGKLDGRMESPGQFKDRRYCSKECMWARNGLISEQAAD